jgi:hypothetical protein
MPYRARVCPNDVGWDHPDGPPKGPNQWKRKAETFPERHGFGFDEWLGCGWPWTGDLLTGMVGEKDYYCGFLQSFQGQPGGFFAGLIYLFTLDPVMGGKIRCYVGEIHNCHKLPLVDAKSVYQEYAKNGQLKTMQSHLSAIHTMPYPFPIYTTTPPYPFTYPKAVLPTATELDIFNVYFEKLTIYPTQRRAPAGDPVYRDHHYNRLYNRHYRELFSALENSTSTDF